MWLAVGKAKIKIAKIVNFDRIAKINALENIKIYSTVHGQDSCISHLIILVYPLTINMHQQGLTDLLAQTLDGPVGMFVAVHNGLHLAGVVPALVHKVLSSGPFSGPAELGETGMDLLVKEFDSLLGVVVGVRCYWIIMMY